MSIFRQIRQQYAETDALFEAKVVDAVSRNDDGAFDEACRAREHNDHAYFLYLFTRFEKETRTAFDLAIGSRSATGNWIDNRAWSAWKAKELRDVPLMVQVEVLTQKGQRDWNQVKELKTDRDDIGHGGFLDRVISVHTIANDLDAIVSRFTK